jgi:hypothetical protein
LDISVKMHPKETMELEPYLDILDSLGSYRDNGKQGTKDLLIHDRRVSWDIQQDGGSNLPAVEGKKHQHYERPAALRETTIMNQKEQANTH